MPKSSDSAIQNAVELHWRSGFCAGYQPIVGWRLQVWGGSCCYRIGRSDSVLEFDWSSYYVPDSCRFIFAIGIR